MSLCGRIYVLSLTLKVILPGERYQARVSPMPSFIDGEAETQTLSITCPESNG